MNKRDRAKRDKRLTELRAAMRRRSQHEFADVVPAEDPRMHLKVSGVAKKKR